MLSWRARSATTPVSFTRWSGHLGKVGGYAALVICS
jgi:hypothetical protein